MFNKKIALFGRMLSTSLTPLPLMLTKGTSMITGPGNSPIALTSKSNLRRFVGLGAGSGETPFC